MWLVALIALPLICGIILLILSWYRWGDLFCERVAMAVTLITLAIAIVCSIRVLPRLNAAEGLPSISPAMEFKPTWMLLNIPSSTSKSTPIWQLSLGLDSIALAMVLLTLIVTVAVLLIARKTVRNARGAYAAWLLVAVSALLMVFTATDLLTFYIGFEFSLIPLFALIAGWGNNGAFDAARRFVLYTLLGSIPMVLALLGICQLYGNDGNMTLHLPTLALRAEEMSAAGLGGTEQSWIFWLLLFGLGIKAAIIPLHTWLPTTYGAANPTTAAFLAAVVLKMGLFGFMRLMLPLTPIACTEFGPLVMGWLGAIAIVAGALIAFAQKDLLLLLAYSSLSHVGFITIGLFALNREGIGGAALQMVNHGVTTAALFLLVACIIARRGTSRMDDNSGGVATQFPRLAFFTLFFVVAAAGMPGLNNFVGEVLALNAMLYRQMPVVLVAAFGGILGAWYSFRMVQRVLFGPVFEVIGHASSKQPDSVNLSFVTTDLTRGQLTLFASLAALCVIIGVAPNFALDVLKPDVERLARVYDATFQSRTSKMANDIEFETSQTALSWALESPFSKPINRE